MTERQSLVAVAVPSLEAHLQGLKYVEIETSRFCNRTCEWCPNGHTLARRHQELMDWLLFQKIVDELGAADYAGWVAFHNYNEPLANPRLDDEIAHLRSSAPGARPAIYTNGDRLRADRLRELLDAGVGYLRVTRYPKDADIAPTWRALEGWTERVGLRGQCAWQRRTLRQGLALVWNDDGVRVEVIAPQVATYNSRGGTAVVPLTPSVRREPCHLTTTSLSVDWRGDVKMCCNVVPDVATHRRYVVGNLLAASIAELWASAQMQRWRALHQSADWSASPVCRRCPQALPETRQ